MKRDWDVIREVLIDIEALDERSGVSYGTGRQDQAKVKHAVLLHDAGFIKAGKSQIGQGTLLLDPVLTWEGHELLEMIRSKPVWERIKKMAADKGIELSFEAVKLLAARALAAMIGD